MMELPFGISERPAFHLARKPRPLPHAPRRISGYLEGSGVACDMLPRTAVSFEVAHEVAIRYDGLVSKA